jgi:hypothetical protein
MRRDKVGEAEVEDCIQNPDFKRELSGGDMEAWKARLGGFLKVVYSEEQERVVVTVTAKKKPAAWAGS